MFQALSQISDGRYVVLRDGRVTGGYSQPEPAHLRRRYEHGQALRELKREARIREALGQEPQGFVERIRVALGFA